MKEIDIIKRHKDKYKELCFNYLQKLKEKNPEKLKEYNQQVYQKRKDKLKQDKCVSKNK